MATLDPLATLPLDNEIRVNASTGVTDTSGNPLQEPFLSTFFTGGGDVSPRMVVGEVYEDSTGLPLPEAMIEVVDLDSGSVLDQVTSDEAGRYLLALDHANIRIRIKNDGFTAAERLLGSQADVLAEPLDARLTPLQPAQPIDRLLDAEIESPWGDRLWIPPGALGEDGTVRLTPISEQGPVSPFPLGWAPISVVSIKAPGQFSPPAALTMSDRTAAAVGRDVVVARFYEPWASWIALEANVVSAEGTVVFDGVDIPGQYAVLLADTGDAAPSPPGPGEALIDASEVGIPLDVEATGVIEPAVGRIGDATPARATVTLEAPTPMRSGTVLLGDFVEMYLLRDGSHRVPLASRQDLIAYRDPSDPTGQTLVASFPVAPSVHLSPLEASEGVIEVTVTRDLEIGRSLVRPRWRRHGDPGWAPLDRAAGCVRSRDSDRSHPGLMVTPFRSRCRIDSPW